MGSLINILLLGSRVVLASVIALVAQLMLLVGRSDFLLVVQQGVRDSTSALFGVFDLPSAYQVGYNFIGGDKGSGTYRYYDFSARNCATHPDLIEWTGDLVLASFADTPGNTNVTIYDGVRWGWTLQCVPEPAGWWAWSSTR